MLHFNTTETFLRKADDTCYGITLVVSVYKDPIVMKTVLIRDNFDDSEPTIEVSRPDWDNNTALSSRELTYLIPTNKQTSSYQPGHGELTNDYNALATQWYQAFIEDEDIKRIYLELCEEFKSHDGYVTT